MDFTGNLPVEILEEIIDTAADVGGQQAASQLSLVCKRFRPRALRHVLSKMTIRFRGNNGIKGDHGFNSWFLKESSNVNCHSRYVTSIFYDCCGIDRQEDPLRLPSNIDLASVFRSVEVLRIGHVDLGDTRYMPQFRALPTVRSLSLESCEMDIFQLAFYLRSFPNLEHLSFLYPRFGPRSLRCEDREGLGKLRLKLQLGWMESDLALLYALSTLPHIFTKISLNYIGKTSYPFRNFLASSSETLTEIKMNRESPSPFLSGT